MNLWDTCISVRLGRFFNYLKQYKEAAGLLTVKLTLMPGTEHFPETKKRGDNPSCFVTSFDWFKIYILLRYFTAISVYLTV